MPSTNEKIDRHLRRKAIRKTLVIGIIAALFIGFMSYSLYKEYGPGSRTVDLFPELNRGKQEGDK
jgi:hypothetical protein